MSLTLIPKSGFVLVRPISTEPAKSESGLVQLADYYHVPDTSGEVIAVAETFRCEDCGAERAPGVEVGDVVIFPPSAGDLVEFGCERYLVIRDTDVLAVVSEGHFAEVA